MLGPTTIYDLTHLDDNVRHQTAIRVMYNISHNTAQIITSLLHAAMSDQDQLNEWLISAAGKALNDLGSMAGFLDEEVRRLERLAAENKGD